MRVRLGLWTLFFVGLTINIHRKGGGLKQDMNPKNILFLLFSLLVIWALAYILEYFQSKKISAIVAFVFSLSFYYFKRVASPLSYNLIINNSDFFYNWAGLSQIFALIHETFFASDFFWSLVFSGLIYGSYAKWSYFLPNNKIKNKLALASLAWILFVSLIPRYSHDPLTNFIRSAVRNYIPYDNALTREVSKLPLAKLIPATTHFNFPQKPNIFLVIIESFNGRFINKKSEEGVEFTPFFNQLTQKHLYFSNYHSNSVQTAKGQFAALCGQVPFSRGIEFKNSKCVTERCVPSFFAENKYTTYFIQADPNFKTDGTQKFMKEHGFQYTPELVKPCGQDPDKCYGLGISDDIFYQRAFQALKEVSPIKNTKPIFVTLTTVSSHMPFNHLSPDEKIIFKKPRNMKENYLNMLRKVDDSIKDLVINFEKSQWAKDSVLIITGDHGFPTDEHGSSHNENYAYEENFVVPLLIYDLRQDLKKQYGDLEHQPFSHMNLGLTLLDLAQVTGPTEFIAPSVFDRQSEAQPVYLVQPYSGGFQASIQWPYKHIFSDYREEGWIFNLEKDPLERAPLDEADNQALFEKMRKVTAQIYRQQEVFVCE